MKRLKLCLLALTFVLACVAVKESDLLQYADMPIA